MDSTRQYYHQFITGLTAVGNREKVFIILLLLFTLLVGFSAPFLYESFFPAPIDPTTQHEIVTTQREPSPSSTRVLIPTNPIAEASLSFSPQEQTIKKGSRFDIAIVLDSNQVNVEAADFTLTYNSSYLTAVNITTGAYFGIYPVAKTDVGTVRISGMAYIKDNTLVIPRGKGAVATITFLAKESVSHTTIGIDRTKTIVASSSTRGKTILTEVTEGTVTIEE